MATVRFNSKAIEERIRKNARDIVYRAAITLQAALKEKLSHPGTGRYYSRSPKIVGGAFGELRLPQVLDILGREDIRVGKLAARGKIVRHRNLRRLGVHRASAPGEPPAKDTGLLRKLVQIDDSGLRDQNPRVRVGTNLEYGAALEYGDPPKLLMRPWVRPTVREKRNEIVSMFTPAALLAGVVDTAITVRPT